MGGQPSLIFEAHESPVVLFRVLLEAADAF